MIIDDIKKTMEDIESFTDTLGLRLSKEDYIIEDMGCPHTQPRNLPKGYSAVYIFFYETGEKAEFFKIGKANKKSAARFTSQHYGFSAPSTLAKSICSDEYFSQQGLNRENINAWMKENLHRINIFITSDDGKALTGLIEATLHYKYRPRYEGSL